MVRESLSLGPGNNQPPGFNGLVQCPRKKEFSVLSHHYDALQKIGFTGEGLVCVTIPSFAPPLLDIRQLTNIVLSPQQHDCVVNRRIQHNGDQVSRQHRNHKNGGQNRGEGHYNDQNHSRQCRRFGVFFFFPISSLPRAHKRKHTLPTTSTHPRNFFHLFFTI